MKSSINISLVTQLIAEQFPQWTHLSITPVANGGWDNRTFHLGDTMLVRLPSAEDYAAQVQKEQQWLPKLAPYLSTQIPEPIAMGFPSAMYPWHWSIYRWIEGESANTLSLDDGQLQRIARELAKFLKELHKISIVDGPPGGLHNYYRGNHPSVYDTETRTNIAELQNIIDSDKALAVWEKAISSRWGKSPVWVHGDFASGNILLKNGKLIAVIDFGCMGIGDPACDLVIAWTFLKNTSRAVFKSILDLDTDTWARARGWALWKSSFELVALEDKASPEAMHRLAIIREILNEHALENH